MCAIWHQITFAVENIEELLNENHVTIMKSFYDKWTTNPTKLNIRFSKLKFKFAWSISVIITDLK